MHMRAVSLATFLDLTNNEAFSLKSLADLTNKRDFILT